MCHHSSDMKAGGSTNKTTAVSIVLENSCFHCVKTYGSMVYRRKRRQKNQSDHDVKRRQNTVCFYYVRETSVVSHLFWKTAVLENSCLRKHLFLENSCYESYHLFREKQLFVPYGLRSPSLPRAGAGEGLHV